MNVQKTSLSSGGCQEQRTIRGSAGLIFACELSRLLRDNPDWNQLVRVCRHNSVLLADEQRDYDAANL